MLEKWKLKIILIWVFPLQWYWKLHWFQFFPPAVVLKIILIRVFPLCCGIDITTILSAMVISNLDILCALATWTGCLGMPTNYKNYENYNKYTSKWINKEGLHFECILLTRTNLYADEFLTIIFRCLVSIALCELFILDAIWWFILFMQPILFLFILDVFSHHSCNQFCSCLL